MKETEAGCKLGWGKQEIGREFLWENFL